MTSKKKMSEAQPQVRAKGLEITWLTEYQRYLVTHGLRAAITEWSMSLEALRHEGSPQAKRLAKLYQKQIDDTKQLRESIEQASDIFLKGAL